MKLQDNALIIQSGGPTAVINQSLAGIMQASKNYKQISNIYGAYHGLHGLLNENLLNLSLVPEDFWPGIANSPGAALGSARLKPKSTDLSRIFAVLTAHNIKYIFYIGGNDSAEAAQLIRAEANNLHYEIQILHIPKTIDNDLLITDHCPGFGSVAKVVANIVAGDDLDNRSFHNSIKINIVMGRHAGWIAAATALAKKAYIGVENYDELGPHLIYVPEIEFREDKFLADVQNVYDQLGRVTITVAEGIADKLKQKCFAGEIDEFGNALLSSSNSLGDYLANLIQKNLKIKTQFGKLRCRADTLGYLQRSFAGMSSLIDQQEAFSLGQQAVHFMMQAKSDQMLILRRENSENYNCTIGLCDLKLVAQQTKLLPRSMLNANANGVSEEFYNYALPLIGALPQLRVLNTARLVKNLSTYLRD